MKRTLIMVLMVAGALVLVFTIAANFVPDWTWGILNSVRNTGAGLLGGGTPRADLSKYASSTGAPMKAGEHASCPSLPKNALYTIVTATPSDESCSPQIGDLALNKYGIVASPLRGWIGCIDGHDLRGVQIDALSSDGESRLASAITNAKGRFVFPTLKAGTYHLGMNSRDLERVDVVVTTSPRSQDALCLVAAGKAGR
jgi:hypothetical protein